MLFKREDLVEKVAKELGLSKNKASDMVSMFFKFIKEEVVDNGKDFRFPEIGGTLKKVIVPARQARSPQTGELVSVPEKWKLKYSFKAVDPNKKEAATSQENN